MASARAVKPGRPLKFGRRAQLVTLTLPDDVVQWLQTVDGDLAWAVVKLYERATKTRRTHPESLADLVQLPGQRALILVKPEPFKNLKGISIIPLADGRGFLALDPGRGVADLELAVIDRLEVKALGTQERNALQHMRMKLKQWRLEGIEFESRSIIVAKRHATAGRTRGLSPIRSVPRDPDVA